jgi:dUTP pyrophosphatase
MEDKILRVELVENDAKTPVYAHKGDAGLDLFSPKNILLKAGEKVIVDTKIKIDLPEDTVGLIWDKGSLGCVFGIKVLGGVFDQNFKGTYTVGLINLSKKDYQIEKGDKICQLLIQPIVNVKVELVKKISSNSPRGSSRFGSSGKK